MSFRPVSFQMGSCAGLRMGWGRGGGRGRGVICRWQWGIVVSAERLFGFFVFFFFSFCFSQSLTFFFSFDFLLMLSIYFGDCQALVWSHASGIFGVLVVRYFYWDEKKKKREYMWICVYTHTPMCVWGMLMGVQKQQWRLLHHTSTLFLGLCYVNAREKKKLADWKCFLFTRR